MTVSQDSLSKGRVTRVENGRVVFLPAGTNYEHHLEGPAYTGPVGKPVNGVIRATARKIYSMPSGGNWVTPILGTPRIIQGRVIAVDEKSITLQAGARFIIELPVGKDTVDLHSGDFAIGAMANAVVMPGVSFEWVA